MKNTTCLQQGQQVPNINISAAPPDCFQSSLFRGAAVRVSGTHYLEPRYVSCSLTKCGHCLAPLINAQCTPRGSSCIYIGVLLLQTWPLKSTLQRSHQRPRASSHVAIKDIFPCWSREVSLKDPAGLQAQAWPCWSNPAGLCHLILLLGMFCVRAEPTAMGPCHGQ